MNLNDGDSLIHRTYGSTVCWSINGRSGVLSRKCWNCACLYCFYIISICCTLKEYNHQLSFLKWWLDIEFITNNKCELYCQFAKTAWNTECFQKFFVQWDLGNKRNNTLVLLGKCSIPLLRSRILDINLITSLSLPPDSVLITSNALPLARLMSLGCLTEMFLQGSDSAVPVALVVSMGMCMNPVLWNLLWNFVLRRTTLHQCGNTAMGSFSTHV